MSAHTVAGRLTLEEFESRAQRAWAARTIGDLERLVTDLPVADPRFRQRPTPLLVAVLSILSGLLLLAWGWTAPAMASGLMMPGCM